MMTLTVLVWFFVGLSAKSQVLFGLVFATRYLDLFTNFVSLYNTSMKIFFLVTTFATIYLIYAKFKATYDGNHDTFRVEFLVIPCALLAVVVNHEFAPMEVRAMGSVDWPHRFDAVNLIERVWQTRSLFIKFCCQVDCIFHVGCQFSAVMESFVEVTCDISINAYQINCA